VIKAVQRRKDAADNDALRLWQQQQQLMQQMQFLLC